jgi:hypothetical protein
MVHNTPESLSGGSRNYPRAVLTTIQAIEIYSYRKNKANRSTKADPLLSGRSVAVAKKFNVSPKAIRDIWNRRTWTHETKHLWTEDERPMIRTERLHTGSPSACSAPCAHFQRVSSRPSCPSPPCSPECVIDGRDTWRWPDCPPLTSSCSVYSNDSAQQHHFHPLSLWSQLLSTPISDSSCMPSQRADAHPSPPHYSLPPPPGPLNAAARAPPPTEMAEEVRAGCAWAGAGGWGDAAEWCDAAPLGAAGAPDPFSLDWPTW